MMGWNHGLWGMGGWGLFGGLFALFLSVALLAALIGAVVWLWRRSDSTLTKVSASRGSAEEILRMRYARGELTREEFNSAMVDLSGSEE